MKQDEFHKRVKNLQQRAPVAVSVNPINNSIKHIRLNRKLTNVLNFLFKCQTGGNGVNLETNRSKVKFKFDVEVSKIKKGLDVFLQRELMRFQERFIEKHKKYVDDLKKKEPRSKSVKFMDEKELRYNLGYDYMLDFTFNFEISPEFYETHIKKHLGSLTVEFDNEVSGTEDLMLDRALSEISNKRDESLQLLTCPGSHQQMKMHMLRKWKLRTEISNFIRHSHNVFSRIRIKGDKRKLTVFFSLKFFTSQLDFFSLKINDFTVI